jgi:hypothetical protein
VIQPAILASITKVAANHPYGYGISFLNNACPSLLLLSFSLHPNKNVKRTSSIVFSSLLNLIY